MRSRAAASEPDEMQIPVLLVSLVLVWSLADGAIVSKCDLREQLEKAIGNLTVTSRQKPLAGADLVAKFVCHAQLASHFNTSLVKRLTTNIYKDPLNLLWPHNRRRRSTLSRRPKDSSGCVRCRRAAEADGGGTFYGIFQFSSRLVCSDGSAPSPTICGLPCSSGFCTWPGYHWCTRRSLLLVTVCCLCLWCLCFTTGFKPFVFTELVDDNISDDIRCLKSIFTVPGNGSLGEADQEELEKMIGLILQPQCCTIQPSVYFAECP
ncbi:uncharacterized protein LOC114858887 isoform X1 [Betta splendens]|uniref:Uncharacterized protein LOC114858887 isoform X1 n=1 Tax=Betta splendens TaxID=158456 RepID=A0A8M1HGD2_BETSP|nr:uncharacterized protein LOC114858887 isoform X1 [Betta splendens]